MPGYLTPDNVPNDQWFVRHIVLPADPQWCAVFDGMLLDLTYSSNWQQQGALTPEYMAEWFWDHYAEFTANHKEAPDYNDANDVDGEPQQPWYEALEDWIIAGFLAITFTPHAAIVYQATVPKLRVAIRTGNIGALFRVLINGIEVWTGDSYAPITDFLEREFDTSGLATPYTVRVEHNGVGEHVPTGRAKLEYVRGDALAQMVATILRADPSGCGIQWSTDNGGTWETIDLAACITGLANDAINQAITDGKLAVPGSQPGGQNPPVPGACRDYHVVLPGNGRWILPFGLSYGDSMEVTNVSGAWSDGSPAWFCSDGSSFGLGICGPGGQGHDEGDVLNPGAYHMQLVMEVGETWYEAPVGSPFLQESGTTPLQVILQANDGSLSDNVGNIEFDIHVCSAGWTHVLDFTSGNQGWSILSMQGNMCGEYQAGIGFVSGTCSPYRYVTIGKVIPSTVITRIKVTSTRLYGEAFESAGHQVFNGDTLIFSEGGTLAAGQSVWEWSGEVTFSQVGILMSANVSLGDTITITQIELQGTGSDPF